MIFTLLLALLAVGLAQNSTFRYDLVIDPGQDADIETKIHALEFTDRSTLRAVVTHGKDTSVSQIGGEEDSVHFMADILPHTAVSVAGDILVGLAPLQAEIFTITRQRQVNTIKVDGIDAWPLSCQRSGICAWQDGGQLHVEPVIGQGHRQDFPVGQNAVLSLDISPDGKLLAAGVNDARVRLWNIEDGRELPAFSMEATPDGSLLGAPVSLQGVLPRSFIVPRPGMATVVRFSPDGAVLAAANETGIHLWNLATAVAAEDKALRLYTLGAKPSMVEICRAATVPHFLALRADGKFVAAGFSDGSVELWKTDAKVLGARIRVLADGWIATAPSGLFDASEGAWHHGAWESRGPGGMRVPMEAFYRDFYRSGLLTDVLTEAPLPTAVDIGNIDPEPPKVSLSVTQTRPEQVEVVPGQAALRHMAERLRFHIEARPGRAGGAVADMQLALNGIVMKKWPRPPDRGTRRGGFTRDRTRHAPRRSAGGRLRVQRERGPIGRYQRVGLGTPDAGVGSSRGAADSACAWHRHRQLQESEIQSQFRGVGRHADHQDACDERRGASTGWPKGDRMVQQAHL
jgi:hypothetical protein